MRCPTSAAPTSLTPRGSGAPWLQEASVRGGEGTAVDGAAVDGTWLVAPPVVGGSSPEQAESATQPASRTPTARRVTDPVRFRRASERERRVGGRTGLLPKTCGSVTKRRLIRCGDRIGGLL